MEEVGKLTPSMFAALCNQRLQEFRRQVWLQNLVVSAVFNAQRTSSEDHYWTPWDFIPDPDRDEGRESIVRTLRGLLMEQHMQWTPEETDKFRQHWTALLTEKGRDDAAAILDDVLKGVQ